MTMRPERRSALVTSTEPTRRRRRAILVAAGAGSALAALGVPRWAGASCTVAAPWSAPADVAQAAPKSFAWGRLLPFTGPLLLFIARDLVVRLGFIKPILLPTPWATLGFRSTRSSALIPLFLLIFGVSDINKVAIDAFGALLIVVFNSAHGVINARKQRVRGATRVQVFKDVLIPESLQPTFAACARRCRWRS